MLVGLGRIVREGRQLAVVGLRTPLLLCNLGQVEGLAKLLILTPLVSSEIMEVPRLHGIHLEVGVGGLVGGGDGGCSVADFDWAAAEVRVRLGEVSLLSRHHYYF